MNIRFPIIIKWNSRTDIITRNSASCPADQILIIHSNIYLGFRIPFARIIYKNFIISITSCHTIDRLDTVACSSYADRTCSSEWSQSQIGRITHRTSQIHSEWRTSLRTSDSHDNGSAIYSSPVIMDEHFEWSEIKSAIIFLYICAAISSRSCIHANG